MVMNLVRRLSRRAREPLDNIFVSMLLPMALLRKMIWWSGATRAAFEAWVDEVFADIAERYTFGGDAIMVECSRHWRCYLRTKYDHTLGYCWRDIERWNGHDILAQAMQHIQTRYWSTDEPDDLETLQFSSRGPRGERLLWELEMNGSWRERTFNEEVAQIMWTLRLQRVSRSEVANARSRGRSRSRARFDGGRSSSNGHPSEPRASRAA